MPNPQNTSVNLEIPFESTPINHPKKIRKMVSYSAAEVLQAAVSYFKGDELAAEVWMNKYCLKQPDGKFLERTPDDMHHRLAGEIARIESKYHSPLQEAEIYALLKDFRYLVPQGGPMTGIGNNYQVASLSNCFVIGQTGKADSYGAIMKTDEEQIQLMKRRGGVGHDLSSIRPSGSTVLNSAMTSTGITPFMERYSNSTREVAQGGRRGALMLTLAVNHPDIKSFIQAKADTTKVTGANVSVKINDSFMKAVREDKNYVLQYPVSSPNPTFSKEVKAKEIWDLIIGNAWKSGEPGVLFWDTILRESVPDCYADLGFETTSTNPCGEIPLCPYDSCRLLAINLISYVKNPFGPDASFDTELFRSHCELAVRIMDDIVDLELEKIDKILEKIENDPEPFELKKTEFNLWNNVRSKCVEGRRIGIGITAEGDMLAALGLRYGTDEAIEQSVKIHKAMAKQCYRTSVDLAKHRGSFTHFDMDREKGNPFISRILEDDAKLASDMALFGRRNISMLTIAPTGTTSLMTQTTSGIEPAFKISYTRRKKVNPEDEKVQVDFVDDLGDSWKEFRVFHPHFKTWLKANGHDSSAVASLDEKSLSELIDKSPYAGSTADEVDWRNKVKMQGLVQKWIDHSISVTVNLPGSVAPSLISELYMLGWESGCKGITVYRDGSRSGVLVSDSTKKEIRSEKEFKRPPSLEADLIRFRNNHEKWIAIIGKLNGKPYEIFTGQAEDTLLIPTYVDKGIVLKVKDKGKNRYDFQYKDKDGYRVTMEGISRAFEEEYWNYAKLISGVMRHDMPINYVVSMVDNLHLNDESLNTWKNGVVRALTKYIPDGTAPDQNICSECSQPSLEYKEGCLSCSNCGHTRCG